MSVISETAALYTPLTEALEELKRRRSDEGLRRNVASYFASQPNIPALSTEPRAVMAPPLVSPNLEFNYFLDVHGQLPLKCLFLEYGQDKFVHLNFEKRCLGKMTFLRQDASGHNEVTGSLRIVDFQRDQGKAMCDIRTIGGENFVDFHHRLVSEYRPDADIEICDFSEWFRNSRRFTPEFPYLRYLGLFITDGILFTNYIADSENEEGQSVFTDTYVFPAFKKLQEIFGVPPLIVPIEPVETDSDHLWCYYPEEVRKFI